MMWFGLIVGLVSIGVSTWMMLFSSVSRKPTMPVWWFLLSTIFLGAGFTAIYSAVWSAR